jgi:hypothetical protein
VLVVSPEAVVGVVVVAPAAPLDLDPVPGGGLVAAAPAGPAPVVVVVGVRDGAGCVVSVVVGVLDDDWAGGTSVEALQIWAYDGATEGGGLLGVSGSLSWNLSPSTSLPGLETDCSVGPLLA